MEKYKTFLSVQFKNWLLEFENECVPLDKGLSWNTLLFNPYPANTEND